jgi:hypothetical protein
MATGRIVPIVFLPNSDDKWMEGVMGVKCYIRIDH